LSTCQHTLKAGRGSSVKTHHDLKVGAEFETHRIEELRTVFKEPFQKHVPQSWIVHCVHHYQLELRLTTYRVPPVCTSLYQSVQGCTRLYQSAQGCTRLYQSGPVWTSLYQSVPVCTRLYKAVQVYTSLYQSVQGCTRLYKSVPVCANMCQYVPVCTSQAYCSLNDLTRLRKLHPLSSTSTRTSRRLATCDQGCHLRLQQIWIQT
jgi:hypothetical protein